MERANAIALITQKRPPLMATLQTFIFIPYSCLVVTLLQRDNRAWHYEYDSIKHMPFATMNYTGVPRKPVFQGPGGVCPPPLPLRSGFVSSSTLIASICCPSIFGSPEPGSLRIKLDPDSFLFGFMFILLLFSVCDRLADTPVTVWRIHVCPFGGYTCDRLADTRVSVWRIHLCPFGGHCLFPKVHRFFRLQAV